MERYECQGIIVWAEVDLAGRTLAAAYLDTVGKYARPDLPHLEIRKHDSVSIHKVLAVQGGM